MSLNTTAHILAKYKELTEGFPTTYTAFDASIRVPEGTIDITEDKGKVYLTGKNRKQLFVETPIFGPIYFEKMFNQLREWMAMFQ